MDELISVVDFPYEVIRYGCLYTPRVYNIKISKKEINKEVDDYRKKEVEKLTNGEGEYIGIYRKKGSNYSKLLIKIKNDITVAMSAEALKSKSKRIDEKSNDYYRSTPEDYFNHLFQFFLKDSDYLILRESSLDGLLVSPRILNGNYKIANSVEMEVLNNVKSAVNDFIIQKGDKTIILSVKGKGHHDKYDNSLRDLNHCFFFSNYLNLSFKEIEVPLTLDKKVDYSKLYYLFRNFLMNELDFPEDELIKLENTYVENLPAEKFIRGNVLVSFINNKVKELNVTNDILNYALSKIQN